MENRINIAELLKDCPKGMELYSPLCGKCVFDRLNMGTIICKKQNTQEVAFTSEGYYMLPVFNDCECMIFPSKDQRDWSKFQRPFKDGDIVITTLGNIAIIRTHVEGKSFCIYGLMVDNNFYKNELAKVCVKRLATEEEKRKLFDAIKANGYRWNAETKTLEKLIEPIFEVGNKIEKCWYRFTIKEVKDDYYLTKCGNKIPIDNQDDFSLVPNKFDITTLKPFDEVLVRDGDTYVWEAHFFSRYYKNSDKPYICIGVEGLNEYRQCIPYDSNKELLGTTNDCDNYYKTWE